MKRTYASGHAKRLEKEKRVKSSTENVKKLTSFFIESTQSTSMTDRPNREHDDDEVAIPGPADVSYTATLSPR